MTAVNRFCCCSLQKGGVVFGWVGVVLSSLQVLASFRILGNLETTKNYPALKYQVESSFAINFVTGVVVLVAFVLLVIGSKKGNRYLLLPWLVTEVGSIIFSAIVSFIIAPIIMTQGAAGIGIAVLVMGLLWFALQLYLFLCVLSLFQELREKDRQKDISLPAVVTHVVTHTFTPTPTTTHTTSYAPASTTYPVPFPPSYDSSDANASKV